MLNRPEVSRRIKAARMMRGDMDQTALNDKLEALGLGKDAAGRLERCELPLTPSRQWAVTVALRMPDRWFTAETVDEAIGYLGDDAYATLEALVRRVTEIGEDLTVLLSEQTLVASTPAILRARRLLASNGPPGQA